MEEPWIGLGTKEVKSEHLWVRNVRDETPGYVWEVQNAQHSSAHWKRSVVMTPTVSISNHASWSTAGQAR